MNILLNAFLNKDSIANKIHLIKGEFISFVKNIFTTLCIFLISKIETQTNNDLARKLTALADSYWTENYYPQSYAKNVFANKDEVEVVDAEIIEETVNVK